MDLNEFAIGVIRALLEQRGLRRAGANHGIGGAAENGADAASAENCGVAGKGADFHGLQIHGADAATNSFVVEHGGEERPAFELFDFIFGLEVADLLVEGVEQLLASGRAGECRAMEQRSAETAE